MSCSPLPVQTRFARDLIIAGARGELLLVLSAFVIEEMRRNVDTKAPRAIPFLETFLSLELVQAVDPHAALVRQVAADIALKDAPIVAGAVKYHRVNSHCDNRRCPLAKAGKTSGRCLDQIAVHRATAA